MSRSNNSRRGSRHAWKSEYWGNRPCSGWTKSKWLKGPSLHRDIARQERRAVKRREIDEMMESWDFPLDTAR